MEDSGPHPTSESGVDGTGRGSELVVRRLDRAPAPGRLVPRQVTRRRVLPPGLLGRVERATRDAVNEELRRNAFVLGA